MTAELHRIAQVAMHTFQRNADTMVAGFLVRHPDIDPADVDLVMTQEGGSVRFSIQPKELHVPPARTMIPLDEFLRQNPGLPPGGYEAERLVTRGWNECRQAMIDATKKARPADALVTTLDEIIEQIAVGADGKPVEIHRG